MQPALLEFRSISKSFDGLLANDAISFSVRPGTIHAIIGENGAGKSTLMKILFGVYTADEGQIFLRGKHLNIKSPLDAKASGIGMVHQHFMLAGALPAMDHMILDEIQKPGFFLRRPMRMKSLMALSEKYQMPVPWSVTVDKLPVGVQQRIEILKILQNDAEILILDEPTAVLTPQGIESFFAQLRSLRLAGKTILIITHKLKEVLSLADDFTVLRKGKAVHSGAAQGQSLESLSTLMVGRRLEAFPALQSAPSQGSNLLVIKNLSLETKGQQLLTNLNLEVRKGEIVGIVGVEGNGQTELLHAILRPSTLIGKLTGEISILNHLSCGPHQRLSHKKIRQLKIAILAEDRIHQSLIVSESVLFNFLLGQQMHREFFGNFFLKRRAILQSCLQVMEKYDVRPLNLDRKLGFFSGGNQQKFVVGRELYRNPELIIAAHPTRGVDVGAIEKIHAELCKQQLENGAGILLISSELDEIFKLSHRIYVMFRGQILAEVQRKDFDRDRVGLLMAGVQT